MSSQDTNSDEIIEERTTEQLDVQSPAKNPGDDPVSTEVVEEVKEEPSVIDLSADDIQQLIDELDELVRKLKAISPGYTPPPYSPQRLLDLIEENKNRFPPEFSLQIVEKLRSSIGEDLFDPDTWKGFWYMLNYYLEYQGDNIKRRMRGEYETDEWGYDPEFTEAMLPFFNFLYTKYFRVETTGIENIPLEGRGVLVSNHSGQLPWDGSMIVNAILNEHPNERLARALYASWFPKMPFVSTMLVKMGQTLADEENGIRLLEQDELVLVFPEGMKGITKLYKDRYKLARFGRGGFVRMALKTRSPLIPVSVVGAEETYIALRHVPVLSKLTGIPFPPISLRWPWFGLLGLVPLPTKWYIDFGEPIPIDDYGPDTSNDLILISQLTNQVRSVIQKMIYKRLTLRESVFFG